MASGSGFDEQRKHTLDALERQCVAAKAELLDHQNRANAKLDTKTPTNNSSRKKGNSFFSSHAGVPRGKDEENGSAYFQLSHPVDENLVGVADSAIVR